MQIRIFKHTLAIALSSVIASAFISLSASASDPVLWVSPCEIVANSLQIDNFHGDLLDGRVKARLLIKYCDTPLVWGQPSIEVKTKSFSEFYEAPQDLDENTVTKNTEEAALAICNQYREKLVIRGFAELKDTACAKTK